MQVLKKRPDGYHEVRVILLPVSLYDELVFSPVSTVEACLQTDGLPLPCPPQDNLVWRAILRLAEKVGREPCWRIRLTKHIPFGAGLGGGSGNAGAALCLANRWWGEPLSMAALRDLAAELGADVPFFLNPLPSLAEGIGERLTPLGWFPCWQLLIVVPALSIATPSAYGKVAPSPRKAPSLPASDPEDWLSLMENDFAPMLEQAHPVLRCIRERLLAGGAQAALLSGSGSAVFGVFSTGAARDRCAEKLRAEQPWHLYCCETLARHSYQT